MAKTAQERITDLEAKKAKLAERLSRLKAKETAAERKKDARRKIVVGAAVLAHAQLDAAFAAALRDVLAKAVTREADRETIADLLPTLAAVPSAASAARKNEKHGSDKAERASA